MTADFVEDAIDSLEKSGANYVVIAGFDESPTCHSAACVPTRPQLEWMKRRFRDLCDKLEAQYEEEL